MTVAPLDHDSFHASLSNDDILVVQCWASWCGGCEAFESVFEAASVRHPDVIFGKIDTGLQPELTKAVGVSQVPSLLVFRQGVLLLRLAGAVGATELESVIAQARALDMDEVRAELEREAREAELAVSM